MRIHPEFDGREWRADFGGKIIRTKSLREMQKLVGRGTKIEGYYPDGYDGKIQYREAREPVSRRGPNV